MIFRKTVSCMSCNYFYTLHLFYNVHVQKIRLMSSMLEIY